MLLNICNVRRGLQCNRSRIDEFMQFFQSDTGRFIAILYRNIAIAWNRALWAWLQMCSDLERKCVCMSMLIDGICCIISEPFTFDKISNVFCCCFFHYVFHTFNLLSSFRSVYVLLYDVVVLFSFMPIRSFDIFNSHTWNRII